MAGDGAFQVEGVVTEVFPNGTCRVELANGHRLLAFASRRVKAALVGLAPGDRVKLQLTPYDLSTGRIVVDSKEI